MLHVRSINTSVLFLMMLSGLLCMHAIRCVVAASNQKTAAVIAQTASESALTYPSEFHCCWDLVSDLNGLVRRCCFA